MGLTPSGCHKIESSKEPGAATAAALSSGMEDVVTVSGRIDGPVHVMVPPALAADNGMEHRRRYHIAASNASATASAPPATETPTAIHMAWLESPESVPEDAPDTGADVGTGVGVAGVGAGVAGDGPGDGAAGPGATSWLRDSVAPGI